MDSVKSSPASGSRSFLFVSSHDYRSKRKANVHFIMRELASRGRARFFSIGFSPLSLIKRDIRVSLWSRSNRIETHEGVDCYLWRTPLHPINLKRRWLAPLERRGFDLYRRHIPGIFKRWAADADTIIVESGLPVLTVDYIRQANPGARIIYLCSDALQTIGCSPYLKTELDRVSSRFDAICVPSPRLKSEFAATVAAHFVPHGMDPVKNSGRPSPYVQGGTNLVSVGSMLFDPHFFELAGPAFPGMTFHIIGGGRNARGLHGPNLKVYDEMPYADTIPFIEHADAGLAPYDGAQVSDYLADTSMKLMQYGAYGLPAVCPAAAAAENPGRFGYEPGDVSSITRAIRAAIARGPGRRTVPLSWAEVTDRLLEPARFPDTRIA